VLGPRGGEPWVLLHGLGSIAATWAPVMRGLRRGCRMIVPELSALGGTRCPGDGLGIGAAVEILRTLIDRELGGRPVTLAGLSLGNLGEGINDGKDKRLDNEKENGKIIKEGTKESYWQVYEVML